MKQSEISSLQIGQRVHNGSSKGVVDMVTDEGNYVRIQWDGVKRTDILSRVSPLWQVLELYR